MLRKGKGQAYKGTKAVNKPNEYVGEGVYFSPHFQVCLNDEYTAAVRVKNQSYHLILQCRVNP